MSGFATIQRAALDHPLLGDASKLGAWTWLILRAAWRPTPFNISGKTITLERGQLCVSIRQLAEAWGWSKSAVDRFLTRLETETMLEREAGQGRCIITISNYEKYQDLSEPSRDSSGTPSGTAAGQQRDTKEPYNHGTSIGSGEGKPSPSQRARKSDFPKPDWAPSSVWQDFLANRKRKGQPNTATAYKRFCDDIARLTNDEWPPGRLLEHAAAHGWAGIYAPRENSDDQRPDKSSPSARFPQRGASTRSLAEDVAADLARSRATG